MLKPLKTFECSCIDDFTGDFCEFKTEQNLLFFLYKSNGLVLNDDGLITQESVTFEDNSYAFESCFTMLNGEAIIFGGWDNNWQAVQVTN